MDHDIIRDSIIQQEKLDRIAAMETEYMEEDKLLGFRLGTDDYVTKPFNSKELIARLNNLITLKRSRANEIEDSILELDSADDKLLKEAEITVIENISNENFNVEHLSNSLNYSTRQLSRIIKKLSGLTTNQFIKEIRLRKAYHLISTKQFATISEVRFEVGITHASYFTQEFEKRFGVLPSEL